LTIGVLVVFAATISCQTANQPYPDQRPGDPILDIFQKRALYVQRFVGRHLYLPRVQSIGSERAYDTTSLTHSAFQQDNTQGFSLRQQLVYMGVEAISIDLHYLSSAENAAGDDDFHVCYSVAPTDDLDLSEYCAVSNSNPCGTEARPTGTTEADCENNFGAYDFGDVHYGCPPDSPTLRNFLVELHDVILEMVTYDPLRFVYVYINDFTGGTNGPNDDGARFSAIVEDVVNDILYIPENSLDYTRPDVWPTLSELTEIENNHLILFTTAEDNVGQAFSASLVDFQDNLMPEFRDRSPPAQCFGSSADVPFFSTAQGRSVTYQYSSPGGQTQCILDDRTDEGQNQIVENDYDDLQSCGYTALPDHVDEENLQSQIWLYPENEPRLSGDHDERRCNLLNVDTGKLRAVDCFKGLYLCKNGRDPLDWIVSENVRNPFERFVLCPIGYKFGVPENPTELAAARQAMINTQLVTDAWVNLVYFRGCWYSRQESGMTCTGAFDDADNEDDSLSGGEIAAIIICSLLVLILLAAIIFFIFSSQKGEQVFTGSGPAAARENPDG